MAIERILNGIKELISSLDEKNNKEYENNIIALNSNVESKNMYKILERLEKSLEQYINKTNKLIYIGMMGHFSTGKSATINSILDLTNDEKRDSGLQPTDNAITLITHFDNNQELEHIATEKLDVPIRVKFIENDLLKNLVLVDTPGSGDPDILNEVVRDFLPICDFIFYFFSATNALDDADIPLLQKKHDELEFIPMKFIITRADEFRKDYDKKLDNDNINNNAIDTFTGTLLTRLKHLIGNLDINQKDIFLIDNRSIYNIDILKDFLITKIKMTNKEDIEMIYEHKIDYFDKQANHIKNFYNDIFMATIDEFDKNDDSLNSKINEFKDVVEITNNKLITKWLEYEQETTQSMEELKERKLKETLKLPESYWDIQDMKSVVQKIDKQINDLSYNAANKKMDIIHVELEDKVYNVINELKMSIMNLSIDNLNTESIERIFEKKIYVDIDSKIDIENEQTVKILQSIKNINKVLHDNNGNLKNKMVSNYKSLQSLTNKNSQQFQKFDSIIQDMKILLENDMQEYFSKVEIYRSGIIALRQNDTLSRLKIAEEMNSIQKNIDSEFRERHLKTCINELLPNYDLNVSNHKLEMQTLSNEINNEFNTFGNKNMILDEEIQDNILNFKDQTSSYLETISRKINNIISEKVDIAKLRINKLLEEEKLKLSKEVRELKRKRRNLLVTIPTLVFICTVVLYILYNTNNIPISSSLAIVIGLGVLSSLISTYITYLIVKIKSNSYKKNINAVKEKFLKKMKQEIEVIFIEDLSLSSDLKIDPIKLQKSIVENLQGQLKVLKHSDQFLKVNTKYEELVESYKNQEDLLVQYKNAFGKFYDSIILYFTSPQDNIDKLSKISNKIKEEVMLPSFNLFEEYQQRVIKLKDKIIKIKFL